MNTKSLAVAAVLPLFFAAGIWACSSSTTADSDDGGAASDGSGGDGSSFGDDDGSAAGDDGSAGDDGGGGSDGGAKDSGKKDSSASDAAKECGAPPTFAPTPSAGVVCTFQAADAASPTCPQTTGEHCCIYPAKTQKPSTCNTVAQNCDDVGDAGLVADFECDEPGDCTTGQCCLVGNVLANSCDHYGQAIEGTRCRPAGCGVGETVVCSAQSDCANDAGTCTGMATKGKDLGVCLP